MTFAEQLVALLLEDVNPPEDESEDISPEELVSGYDAATKPGGKILSLIPHGVDQHAVLRAVAVDATQTYYLVLWDSYERDSYGKSVLGYRFTGPGGRVLFQGTDFHVPGVIDSDEVIVELLHWLVLKPGDTDEEHFADYTPEQLAFAEGQDADIISMDIEGGTKPFQDLPGFEH